jgi:uncharacterized membrane protein YedE/YeeE
MLSILPLAGLLIGLAFGATVQRTHFCIMGALSDAFLFGSFTRLRSWLLAIALAVLGTQVAIALGLVQAGRPMSFIPADVGLLPFALGGLALGFGMVLAGGCPSRQLALLGAGSGRALLVLLVFALCATLLFAGPLVPPVWGLLAHVAWNPWPPGTSGGLVDVALGGIVGVALLVFCLGDARFRGSRPELVAGIVLGLLVVLGWLLTAPPRPVGAVPPASLNFAVPVFDAVVAAMARRAPSGFLVALVLGVPGGALLASLLARRFRLQAFAGRDDVVRAIAGGALMGIGASLGMGDAVGHGLSGLAALFPGSLIAVLAMAAGVRWALRYLETGRILPPLPAGRRATGGRPRA